MFLGFVLVVGGANLGLGTHIPAQPVAGFCVAFFGLAVWIGSFHFARNLPWRRTFVLATVVVPLALAALQLYIFFLDGHAGAFGLYLSLTILASVVLFLGWVRRTGRNVQ